MLNISEKLKKIWQQLKETQVPPALRTMQIKRSLFAIMVFAVTILSAILTKNVGFLVGAIIGLYLLYLVVAIKYDYANGKIAEYTLTCLYIKTQPNRLAIVFADDEDNRDVFFTLNKKDNFIEDIKYTIYCKNESKVIIAYEQS